MALRGVFCVSNISKTIRASENLKQPSGCRKTSAISSQNLSSLAQLDQILWPKNRKKRVGETPLIFDKYELSGHFKGFFVPRIFFLYIFFFWKNIRFFKDFDPLNFIFRWKLSPQWIFEKYFHIAMILPHKSKGVPRLWGAHRAP